MRTDVISYIQGLNLGTYIASNELPFNESGVPLYIKNLKKVYVNVDQFTFDPILYTLNGVNIIEETTVVTIFFANDAKSIPPNYDDVVSQLKAAKDILPTAGYNRRQASVQTSYDTDKLVTEIELRFIKLT